MTPRILPRTAAGRELLSLVRRAEPFVLWTPPEMNGGNYLYLWLTAWRRRATSSQQWSVLYRPKMEPWLTEFPALRGLTIHESEVSLFSRRTVEWGQQVGTDFLKSDILPFVREVLLEGSSFPDRVKRAVPAATVINVRRGDYYSDPQNAEWYGMDIRGYVAHALKRVPAESRGPVLMVSDDPQWCQQNLTTLPGMGEAKVLDGPHDMFNDLAQLAAARYLILANSTFSYWGGYLASAAPSGERATLIQAPLLFNRRYGRGESTLLLDQWLALPSDEYERASD